MPYMLSFRCIFTRWWTEKPGFIQKTIKTCRTSTRNMGTKTKIKSVLIDLSGTIHVEDEPTPNAIEALTRLLSVKDIHVRFVTNTTKESKQTLLQRLHKIGFSSITKDDMFTSLSAAVEYVQSNQLRPFYLLTEDAKKEFSEVSGNGENSIENSNSVVVGLAPDSFSYEILNQAFRVLMKEDSKLIAVHEGKYYKRGDGLAIGPGFFTRGLEYATGKSAAVIGKPNAYFFNCAIPPNTTASECCMIGDDINDDVFGGMNVGMKGILVKTGKYITGIEAKYSQKPTNICNSFADAVNWLIEENFVI